MKSYLRAHKAAEIKRSILVISFYVVKSLKRKTIKLEKLFEQLKKKLGITRKDLVLTLNFLYALGILDYIKETDEIRYLK